MNARRMLGRRIGTAVIAADIAKGIAACEWGPWGSETLSPAADSVHQLDPPQARFRSATYGLIRRDLMGSEADEWSAFDVDRADLVFARARETS
jgi:hypothetical protein